MSLEEAIEQHTIAIKANTAMLQSLTAVLGANTPKIEIISGECTVEAIDNPPPGDTPTVTDDDVRMVLKDVTDRSAIVSIMQEASDGKHKRLQDLTIDQVQDAYTLAVAYVEAQVFDSAA